MRWVKPLFFYKTQASLPDESLGAKDLSAIQDPAGFYLSFMPPHKCNLSSDQVIQPHGLDLAHTRHIYIGSFTTASICFSVLLFFPHTAAGKKMSASSNSLSLDPYESLPDYARQEISSSYDLIYANRAFHLSYYIPRESLAAFWASVVRRANKYIVATRRGKAFPYFQNPRLLFQSHDLKNTFARPSLHESMTLFRDMVLGGLDPAQLDIRASYIHFILLVPSLFHVEGQN
ncbi:hypothetical protein BGZ61DRAFT_501158 [Ilyonectria robusta]|uniref:uncharacterized protein n=1 Tax=Ilyonectria robusta TaxID=1079257 RepID=UPI001E8E7EA8|nr:uncharacterized protein BGZ61DRAFT_501158 [Ilyonectria robusta]KAH8648878.1 hypothetical protein BGZ61DRAFT_501158 [Ilyonectria robusta]